MALMPDDLWLNQVALLGALIVTTAAVARRFGGEPERAVAKVLLVMIAVDALLLLLPARLPTGLQLETVRTMRDIAFLLWLGAIALRANRLYPLLMAGAAMVAVLAQLLFWAGWLEGRLAYFVLIATPSFAALAVFWFGLICHRRRISRGFEGPD